MITGLMIIIAYILPLPIMAACFYYNVFSFVDGAFMRLAAIGVTGLAPLAIIMLFVLKRIVHLVLTVIGIIGILFSLHYFGLIPLTTR